MGLVCEECGYNLDAHADVFDDDETATPEPGDMSMCLNCGFLTIFEHNDGKLHLRPMYESDIMAMPNENRQQVEALLRARKAIIKGD